MIEELKKTFDTFNKKISVWGIQQNKREENFKKFGDMITTANIKPIEIKKTGICCPFSS